MYDLCAAHLFVSVEVGLVFRNSQSSATAIPISAAASVMSQRLQATESERKDVSDSEAKN
jgi:hypothetical protein